MLAYGYKNKKKNDVNPEMEKSKLFGPQATQTNTYEKASIISKTRIVIKSCHSYLPRIKLEGEIEF